MGRGPLFWPPGFFGAIEQQLMTRLRRRQKTHVSLPLHRRFHFAFCRSPHPIGYGCYPGLIPWTKPGGPAVLRHEPRENCRLHQAHQPAGRGELVFLIDFACCRFLDRPKQRIQPFTRVGMPHKRLTH